METSKKTLIVGLVAEGTSEVVVDGRTAFTAGHLFYSVRVVYLWHSAGQMFVAQRYNNLDSLIIV